MTNQASEDELGEILNRLEIESDMSADDFGSYWIEGKPEAKQALLDWHNKQIEELLNRLIASGDSEGRIWVETIKSVLGQARRGGEIV